MVTMNKHEGTTVLWSTMFPDHAFITNLTMVIYPYLPWFMTMDFMDSHGIDHDEPLISMDREHCQTCFVKWHHGTMVYQYHGYPGEKMTMVDHGYHGQRTW